MKTKILQTVSSLEPDFQEDTGLVRKALQHADHPRQRMQQPSPPQLSIKQKPPLLAELFL